MRRLLTALVALACLGADGEDPLKASERCERAPALSPFELVDLTVTRPAAGLIPPACARRLLALGPRAEKVLISSLSEDDPALRDRAVWLLGVLGRDGAVAPLAKLLGPEAPGVAEAIGRIGGDLAAKALAAQPDLPEARHALSRLGGPIAVAALQPCATESCAEEWLGAAGLDDLQAIPPPAPLLRKCADVAECWVDALSGAEAERRLAVRWLARLGAVGRVVEALRDPSPAVRAEAREMLLLRPPASPGGPAASELAPAERVWLTYVGLRK